MDIALNALAEPRRQDILNIASDEEKAGAVVDLVARTPTSQSTVIVEGTLFADKRFALSELSGRQQSVIVAPLRHPTRCTPTDGRHGYELGGVDSRSHSCYRISHR